MRGLKSGETIAKAGFFIFLTPLIAFQLTIVALLLILFLLIIIISNFGRAIIKKIIGKLAFKFIGFSKSLLYLLKSKKKILILNYLITLLKWLISSIFICLIFMALDVKISIIYIFLISAVSQLISIIPITLSGLGIREVSSVYLYSLINVEPAKVISISLIMLLFNYLTASIVLLKYK